ncbi:MAG: DNA-directed RNA polymerase subunit omega [Clostridia bacterium]|nr:DNA-directed RNA polymerase subunit omega [Clostridia bacterium]
MIIEPTVSKLMKTSNMESRYTLVVATAKRARELAMADAKLEKTVSMAVKEIADGKINIIPVAEEAGEDE